MFNKQTGPFEVKISLRLLKEQFETLLGSSNKIEQEQAKYALQVFKEHPVLWQGTQLPEEFLKAKPAINAIMSLLFPAVLSNNEIRGALMPYSNDVFYCTTRLQNIIANTESKGTIFDSLFKDYQDSFNLLSYAIILNSYYNYDIDFNRPKTISVTDKNGIKKRYRTTFNADYLDVYPNEKAVEITEDILNDLLTNGKDLGVWEKYFPKGSWTIEGFGIVNLIDTTLDEHIDVLKTHLIQTNNKENILFLNQDFQHIFNLPNLKTGAFLVENDNVVPSKKTNFETLTTATLEESISIKEYADKSLVKRLFENGETIVIANVEHYDKLNQNNRLSHVLLNRGIKSIALIPVKIKEKLAFVIELASEIPNQLNAINLVKLETIMPFILSYSVRIFNEYENEISAIIQQECTAIHPSVKWRFDQEAIKFIEHQNSQEASGFEEIVFKHVYALYGQIDIVGSSNARNEAIRTDLKKQLEQSRTLIKKRSNQQQNLPFYEQLIYEIDKHLFELSNNFNTSSEQEITLFFEKQLFPLFQHLTEKEKESNDIEAFLERIDKNTQMIYEARKQYDYTIDKGNKILSCFMDKQQLEAQKMFPHYFEKFKTDGVEHNMYIGQSISQYEKFHTTDLYNLRLWQLQVACEMEAMYYKKQSEFPLQLQVASLILAYDVPLTIRYRMDEKQFDVDGAYNVRYEMIKKRIDKAYLKNSTERLTQANKLCVVYSSANIEREYLRYFEFLQSKNYIGKNIELVELEELQGASGIKAIRVEINHDLDQVAKVFTIEDVQTA